jgi:hypothetical protein
MIVSVNVGFLYMAMLVLNAVFSMEMSRYFIELFCSVSAVKCKFGCVELKYVWAACMLLCLES